MDPPKDKGEMGDPTHSKENGTKDQGEIGDSLETPGKMGGDPKHKRNWGGGNPRRNGGPQTQRGMGAPKTHGGKGGVNPKPQGY